MYTLGAKFSWFMGHSVNREFQNWRADYWFLCYCDTAFWISLFIVRRGYTITILNSIVIQPCACGIPKADYFDVPVADFSLENLQMCLGLLGGQTGATGIKL